MKHGTINPAPREILRLALVKILAAAAALGLFFIEPVFSQTTSDLRSYRLNPGDKISIAVFGEPELSGEVFIDISGNIQLPIVGAVQVADLTAEECRKRIVEHLADGILNQPSVSIRISE